jgi:hypothetical protein
MNVGAKILALATRANAKVYVGITGVYDKWGYLIDLLEANNIRAGDSEVSVLASAMNDKLYGSTT